MQPSSETTVTSDLATTERELRVDPHGLMDDPRFDGLADEAATRLHGALDELSALARA